MKSRFIALMLMVTTSLFGQGTADPNWITEDLFDELGSAYWREGGLQDTFVIASKLQEKADKLIEAVERWQRVPRFGELVKESFREDLMRILELERAFCGTDRRSLTKGPPKPPKKKLTGPKKIELHGLFDKGNKK